MTGKEKCKILKDIRKDLADKLKININQKECTYEGECKGTCPKCQQEEEKLNKALLKKGALAAAVIGASMAVTGCDAISGIRSDLRRRANEMIEEYGTEKESEQLEVLSGEVDTTVNMTENYNDLDGDYDLMGIVPYVEEKEISVGQDVVESVDRVD